jgi:arsenite-transporting ATPase
MVIEEAKRAYTYLQLYGYGVDAVVVNRILPEEGTGEVFGPYVAAQKQYLAEIDASFAPLPIIPIPHRGREVFGMELLREIGRTLYGDGDTTALMYAGQTYRVTQEGAEYLLELRLPFAHEGEVTALHAGEQLVIQLAGQRRNYLLPRFLAYYTLGETGVKNGWLRVRFARAAA